MMHTRRYIPPTRYRSRAFLAHRCLFPALIVALLMAALAVAPASARAATDTVTNCAASGPGSLPAVLASANADDTITFALDCTDANAITLTATLVPTVNVTIDALTPLHAVTISGGVRLFRVTRSITLGVRGLTFANGLSDTLGGGAIYTTGTVNVSNCTFSSNAAYNAPYNVADGGAIYSSGTLNVVNSTFFGNSTPSGGKGGAIYSFETTNVVGCTLSGNTATDYGGAIYNFGGPLRLALSVVAGNTAFLGPDLYGVVTDGGGNVISSMAGSSGFTAPDNRLNIPTLLAPFADNGGAVQTFALMPGSPAIGIAACPIDPTTGAPLATDARGVSRPQGANCDAGSYQTSASSQASLITHAVNSGILSRDTQ